MQLTTREEFFESACAILDEARNLKRLVLQLPKKLPDESGCVIIAVVHNASSGKDDYEQPMPMRKNRKEDTPKN